MKKKWFTLLELLIVMTILGILFVMLLNTYNRISTMVFRVQQEKEVSQEILQISQLFQNFSDRNTIDYTKYVGTGWLSKTQWITDVLYLSWQDGALSFFTRGDCNDPAIEYSLTWDALWSGCSLFLQKNDATPVELINTKKITISKVIFKVIPFASQQQYLDSDDLCTEWNYLHCINTPGFRVLFQAYSVNYGRQWANHVTRAFQQFF